MGGSVFPISAGYFDTADYCRIQIFLLFELHAQSMVYAPDHHCCLDAVRAEMTSTDHCQVHMMGNFLLQENQSLYHLF